MNEHNETSNVQLRLQRLWKGTLLIGIGGAYVLFLGLLFIYYGWRAALMAVFVLVLSQFFRYIANDIDRIGWQISKDAKFSDDTKHYQSRLIYLMVGLILLLNVALITQAYLLGGLEWTIGTVAILAFVEILYIQVRKVNRTTEFEQASYGLTEGNVLQDGPERNSPPDIEKKLERLKSLADDGKISQKSYEKTRDAYWIHSVMGNELKIRFGADA
ncbi:MAG: hypothetical protein AAF512_00070 [Pseudomonadota bacterium]